MHFTSVIPPHHQGYNGFLFSPLGAVMNIFDQIQKPTLLLDEETARANLHRISRRVRQAGARFRPHFKTHQSAEIGEWFRAEGVSAITVSSLDMAAYFCSHGWQDNTLAFPVNLRQIDLLNDLAARIKFGILVESIEAVRFLDGRLKAPVEVWIKIDTGNGRAGLAWDNLPALEQLAASVESANKMRLAGLLTHAGQTYHASSPDEICRIYTESVNRINHARDALMEKGIHRLEVSVGDTPGVSRCEAGRVDELRPGNFIFYDAQQLQIGSCHEHNIAVALACPVVALHPDRNEAILYGGAIHLSSEFLMEKDHRVYGRIALPEGNRWGEMLKGAYLRGLSQEHGIVRLETEDMKRVRIGDLICVLPVHSCLAVHLMRGYSTLDGRLIHTMN
jgi:D-serine deaminase-like pyridoxal phosphate-dependent protein